MKLMQVLILVAAITVITGCKKTQYSNTSTAGTPVFSFSGFVNSTPVNIQAGVNNYVMNTSYGKDVNGVYNYTGAFQSSTCTSACPNSLVITIKDYRVFSSSDSTHIDSLIYPGYFTYSIPSGGATSYNVTFGDFFDTVATGYAWAFGDGQTGNTHNPTHTYLHPGIYIVTLKTSSATCYSTDANDATVGQVGNAFISPFSNGSWISVAGGDSTNFSAVPNGIAPYTFVWNFGDGHTKTGYPGEHTFKTPGIYYVSVSCTDATGYTDIQGVNIAVPSAVGCANGFYENTKTPVANPKNLNDAIVQWYDNSGVLWTSENNNQHANSLFRVTSVSPYKNNTAGQPTLMVKAQLTCELYNSANDSVPLSGTAVFAVAHF